MYRSKTVFVVGAGASAEVGLPIGHDLKGQIIRRLKVTEDDFGHLRPSNGEVWDALVQFCRDDGNCHPTTLARVASEICKALPLGPSIDVILQSRDHDNLFAVCSKVAISHAILEGERKSLLASKNNKRPDILSEEVVGTWYNRLGLSLAENLVKGQTLERIFENTAFVVFNYDRCVEHYLFWHLRLYFGLSESDAKNLLSTAKFYHPYGTVGRLPWQDGAGEAVEFGEHTNRFKLLDVRLGLRTFSERLEDDSQMDEWQSQLTQSSKVVFLGFSFIEQNMKLLSVDQPSNVEAVYATGFGLSESNQRQANLDIRSALKSKLGLDDKSVLVRSHKCSNLFDEYSLSLTR